MQGLFLSTPSARRATSFLVSAAVCFGISIHALREEGDDHPGLFSRGVDISIHALREEGDDHPGLFSRGVDISIHALREEGDPIRSSIFH